mmetsp:Transcript_18670/g.42994  ORF Transcript_18670/g.42994 Transcript_18670/m.42994 type:complete len:296 (+) Transcript_18670:284-1171(+)
MSVISKTNFLGKATTAFVVFFAAIGFQLQHHVVDGAIVVTLMEEKCLEKTAVMFDNAGVDLLQMRNDFSDALKMEITSKDKMVASYPDDQVKPYNTLCSKYGGKLHNIKLDFFDCFLTGSKEDIELTLKNFANCMANDNVCEGFNQEHMIQQAWKELGLTCMLEEEETKKDTPQKKKVDNDTTKKEKEAAAKGADEVDKEEKKAEYIPKEYKNRNRKKKGGFMKFVLFCSVCAAGYFVFDRHRQGLPIELPFGRRLPFGGVTTSRFQGSQQTGFVSDYNLLSIDDNDLQLSSNLA